MTEDILHPRALIIPKVTKAVRDGLTAEAGTLVLITDTNQLSVATTSGVAGSTSWAVLN